MPDYFYPFKQKKTFLLNESFEGTQLVGSQKAKSEGNLKFFLFSVFHQ